MQQTSIREAGKSNVLLTELVIVILFFALTAVTVLQLFVGAHKKSQSIAQINRASIIAQDWAELLATERQPEAILKAHDFADGKAPGSYEIIDGDLRIVMQVVRQDTPAGGLVTTRIGVYKDAGYDGEQDAPKSPPLTELSAATYIPGDAPGAGQQTDAKEAP